MKVLSNEQMASIKCGMKVDCAFALVGMCIALVGFTVATAGFAAAGVMVAASESISFVGSLLGVGWAGKDIVLGCL